MNIKVYTGAVFGVGVLLGWAVTADRADLRMKKLEDSLMDRFKEYSAQQDEEWIDFVKEKNEYIFALREKLYSSPTSHVQALSPDEIREVLRQVDPDVEDENILEDPENDFEEPIIDLSNIDDDHIPTEDEALENAIETGRANLQRLIEQYVPSDSYDEDVIRHSATTSEPEVDKTPPFIIDQAEYSYGDDGAHYDKLTLTYYPNDRVLLENDEYVVDNIDTVVGWENLTQFGHLSGDADTVFVRNKRTETDYEIVRELDPPPVHVRYGMDKMEFETRRAAGLIKFRPEDL